MSFKSDFALPKSHRLRSTSLIQQLFKSQHTVKEFPLLVHYFWSADQNYHQFMPIVSKRKFKRAVDRNRLKRQLKEIWRLNQHLIQSEGKEFLVIGLAYIATKKLKYNQIETAFLSLVNSLNNETKNHS